MKAASDRGAHFARRLCSRKSKLQAWCACCRLGGAQDMLRWTACNRHAAGQQERKRHPAMTRPLLTQPALAALPPNPNTPPTRAAGVRPGAAAAAGAPDTAARPRPPHRARLPAPHRNRPVRNPRHLIRRRAAAAPGRGGAGGTWLHHGGSGTLTCRATRLNAPPMPLRWGTQALHV